MQARDRSHWLLLLGALALLALAAPCEAKKKKKVRSGHGCPRAPTAPHAEIFIS
jgi:hypothetical protein